MREIIRIVFGLGMCVGFVFLVLADFWAFAFRLEAGQVVLAYLGSLGMIAGGFKLNCKP